MASSFSRSVLSVVRKIAVGVLLAVMGLAAYGIHLFVEDDVDLAVQRDRRLAALQTARQDLADRDARLQNRLLQSQETLPHVLRRAEQLNELARGLRDARPWWRRLIGKRDEQAVQEGRLALVEQAARETSAEASRLTELIEKLTAEHARIEKEFARIDRDLAFARQIETPLMHYASETWMRARHFVFAGLFLYFFGTLIRKFIVFYGIAPGVARGRPVQLEETMSSLPHAEESRSSLELALWPGEILWSRSEYLRLVVGAAVERKRSVLDWSLPVASWLSGLTGLAEVRNQQAGQKCQATLAAVGDPQLAFAVVHIPDKSSIVVRLSHLAGAISHASHPLRIRQRWRLRRWQAWIGGQFRYCEFQGPCRLIVMGQRGIKAERLSAGEDDPLPFRRTQLHALIGFTPNLEYSVRRTPRFWNYWYHRGRLFDPVFSGSGLFIVQQAPPPTQARAFRRILAGVHGRFVRAGGV